MLTSIASGTVFLNTHQFHHLGGLHARCPHYCLILSGLDKWWFTVFYEHLNEEAVCG